MAMLPEPASFAGGWGLLQVSCYLHGLRAMERLLAVLATQEIRRMRGGAQSHLMLASDGKLYVVKFQNNPQHIRVLANEMLATRLGPPSGLPFRIAKSSKSPIGSSATRPS